MQFHTTRESHTLQSQQCTNLVSNREKLKRTEAAIEDYRAHFHEHKPENYGFASMAAVPYAHVVAKMLVGKHPKGTEQLDLLVGQIAGDKVFSLFAQSQEVVTADVKNLAHL